MFHVKHSTRVIGPPGTGKTHTLIRVVADAVGRYGADRVVVASYTRKAASEIRARSGADLPDHVGTIHALAARAVARSGEPIRVLETRKGIARFLVDSPRWADDVDALLGALAVHRARGDTPESWPADLRLFSRDWSLYLQDEGGVDFSGILERAIELEALPCEAPALVAHDEAQDSTALERRYLNLMVARGAVLVEFGDPLQTLYQFRGAQPEAFTGRLVETEHLLEQSYRVPRRVLRLAAAFMGRHGCELPPYLPRAAEGLVRSLRGSPGRPTAAFVDRVVESAGSHGSMMVLAPTRQGVRGLLDALQARGYPYGSASHEGRPWSPLKDPLAARVADMVAPSIEGRPTWSWGELRSWTTIRPEKLLQGQPARDMLSAEGRLGAPPDFILRQILTPTAYAARGVAGLLAVAELPDHTRRLGDYCERVARNHGIAYLRGTAPSLQVSTIHAAKGGEADAVWIADDFGRRFGREMNTAVGWQAVRNMAYVAITRARHEVSLLDAGRHSLGLARFASV